ncbi:MAG: CoA transferase [Actinobacteria bacterium]|nr:CoA transferase [Actinomycetota bacterium]
MLALTAGVAGPSASRCLAQCGAEVIKFESLNGGLDSFRFYSTGDDIEASGRFLENNLNVKSAQLNLKNETARRLFVELVAKSDVVIENFRPDVMTRLGLGLDVLREAKPDLIYMKMPGMGSTGPKSWYGTWGQTLNAVAGMTYLWNHPGKPRPVGFQGAYPDYVAAALAPTAVMAALLRRRKSGEGAYLELAQAEMVAYLLGVSYATSLVNGRDPEPIGNDWPGAAPHNCYPCEGDDRWCVIAVETDEQWQRLCEAIGRPELAADAGFATLAARRGRLDEIDELLAAWTSRRDAHEVMRLLQAAAVPCGAVQKAEDLYADPQLRTRELVRMTRHAAFGEIPVATLPIHFAELQLHEPEAMRELGADNAHVFCDLLGYTREQLAEWQETDVVK